MSIANVPCSQQVQTRRCEVTAELTRVVAMDRLHRRRLAMDLIALPMLQWESSG